MKFTANQIAEILEGVVVGDENVEVNTLSKIEEGEKGSLTFLSNPKYTNFIYSTKASIVIVNNDFVSENNLSSTLIKVKDAYQSFTKLLNFYNEYKSNKLGIEEHVIVSKSAKVGKNIYLGSFSYIGDNVIIGDNVKIYPNVYIGDDTIIGSNTTIYSGVKIYSQCVVGNECEIHSGVIIGSDGFGFAPSKDGTFNKIPQIGNVEIGNNVNIGAGTTIDRATLGSTRIGNGVKLDNQIQVAHNVEIGENTVIASQTGIAGSTKVGSNCMIGGQVGIAGHLIIGNNVRIQGKSGVIKSIKNNKAIQGTPAFDYNDFYKSYVYFKNFPSLAKQINSLEQEIKALKEQ